MDERLNRLKLILGISDTTQDALLTFVIETMEEQVLSYIGHETLPIELERTLVQMTAEQWRIGSAGHSEQSTGAVTSVKRGDVTTAFATPVHSNSDGFYGYRTTLNAHRKLRW